MSVTTKLPVLASAGLLLVRYGNRRRGDLTPGEQ